MVFDDPFLSLLFELFQFHSNKRTNRQMANRIKKNHRHETAQGLQDAGIIIIGYYRAVGITHGSGLVMHSKIIKFIFIRLAPAHKAPGSVVYSYVTRSFFSIFKHDF